MDVYLVALRGGMKFGLAVRVHRTDKCRRCFDDRWFLTTATASRAAYTQKRTSRAPIMNLSDDQATTGLRVHATNMLLICTYVIAYVFLDWLSYIHPVGPYAITVWNPPAGVSLALLLGFGLRYAPALFIAAALAELALRPGQAQLADVMIYAAILSGGYTALEAMLRRMRVDP